MIWSAGVFLPAHALPHALCMVVYIRCIEGSIWHDDHGVSLCEYYILVHVYIID